MSRAIIENCSLVSSGRAEIMIPYIVSIRDTGYNTFGFHPQIALRSMSPTNPVKTQVNTGKLMDPVYIPYICQVVDVGKYTVSVSNSSQIGDIKYSVTLLIDDSQCYQVKNLLELCDFYVGDTLDVGQLFGYYASNSYVEVAYMNTAVSNWPVRVMDTQYYKQNPDKLLSGELEIVVSQRKYIQYEDLSVESSTPHEIQTVFDDDSYDTDLGLPSKPTTIIWE